jgi:hypothetical protein
MRLVIDGKRLDTEKAALHFNMSYWDGHNNINGDLYKSSKGHWYMLTPSQWESRKYWILTTPHEVIEVYRDFFDEDEIATISSHIDGWE